MKSGDIERISREQREEIRRLTKKFGFDGSPQDPESWIPRVKKRGKPGRKRGSKNLSLRERLRRRGVTYD